MRFSKKLIFLFSILAIFLLNVSPVANAYTNMVAIEAPLHGSMVEVPEALDPIKEQKALEDYIRDNSTNFNNANGLIELTTNKPIVLTFEDGSRVEYSLVKQNKTTNSLGLLDPVVSPQANDVTYKVQKSYFYLIGNAQISLIADCTHNNREVIINRAYDKVTASLASVSNRKVSIIKKRGYNNTYAKAEASGDIQFEITKLGPWLFRTYRFQIFIDPSGACYLHVLD